MKLLPFLCSAFLLMSCGGDPVGGNENPDNPNNENTENPDTPSESDKEWGEYAIPVSAPSGTKWTLHEASDEFNYKFEAGSPSVEFLDRWVDFYHKPWSGPAPTVWQKDHFYVEDGILKLFVSRPEDAPMVSVAKGDEKIEMQATYAACITSKHRVSYPAYVEAYAQIANSTMASDVWMLSSDDTQEIDIIEAYGSDRDNGGYGADRIHLSHHMFIRDPFTDYQPMDAGSWYRSPSGTIWREDYHRVGIYWRDPFHLEYYIDGQLVRIVSGENLIDPKGHNENGTGIDKEMDLIINMEDQSWRATQTPSLSPTSEELENRENQTFKVKWVRAYTAVEN